MKCINKSISLLASAVLAAAQPGSSQAASPCVPVDGARILGRHLRLASPVWAAIPETYFAGWAPGLGMERVFGVREQRVLAGKFGIAAGDLAPIRFCALGERLNAERVHGAILAALAGGGQTPDSVEVADFSRFPVPKGELSFRQAPWRGAQSGSVLVPGTILTDGRSQPVWARVRVRYRVRRWTAAVPLPAGSPIGSGKMRLEETMSSEPARPPPPEADLAGLAPRRTIAAGQAVDPERLTVPPVIRRGDKVVVESRRGNARIEIEATAESPGWKGERVVVRNALSGRKFAATVRGPGRASAGLCATVACP